MAIIVAISLLFTTMFFIHISGDVGSSLSQRDAELSSIISKYPLELDKNIYPRIQVIIKEDVILSPLLAGDRVGLQKAIKPRVDALRAQFGQDIIVHFYDKQGNSFLRSHSPKVTGNCPSGRSMIKEAIHSGEPRSGFDVGVSGVHYRIAQPIVTAGKVSGVIEIGVGLPHLFERLHDRLDVESAFIAPQEVANAIAGKKLASSPATRSTLISIRDTHFLPMAGQIFTGKNHGEMKAADGSTWVLHTDHILYDYAGKKLGTLAIFQDITDKRSGLNTFIITAAAVIPLFLVITAFVLKISFVNVVAQLEAEQQKGKKELIQKNAQLAELNRELEKKIISEVEKRVRSEQFISDQRRFIDMGHTINAIAHQWRQPLNAVGLLVQDLSEAYHAGELTEDYLKNTEELCMKLITNMSETIDNFRNYFTTETTPAPYSAHKEAEHALSMISAQLTAAGIAFDISSLNSSSLPDEQVFTMNGYADDLRQVLLILLSNSRDALLAHPELTEKSIKILVEATVEMVTISVTDTGGGVAQKLLNRIFDPYFTTKPEGKGTGMGLYVAKMIVTEHMNGVITAENRNGGLTVTARLPKMYAR